MKIAVRLPPCKIERKKGGKDGKRKRNGFGFRQPNMTKKIFQSIFTVALVVLLSSIGIATSFLYDYFNESQQSQLKAELMLVADTVNEVGVEYFDNFDSSVFRFTIVDADGTVLYDTQAKADEMGNHAEREEIAEAFESVEPRFIDILRSAAENIRDFHQKQVDTIILILIIIFKFIQ